MRKIAMGQWSEKTCENGEIRKRLQTQDTSRKLELKSGTWKEVFQLPRRQKLVLMPHKTKLGRDGVICGGRCWVIPAHSDVAQ